MKPYVYLISWKALDVHYCGSRYSHDCHPSDLWKTYFTSSDYVKLFREENGEPDHIEILKEFDVAEDAKSYEEQKLIEFDVLNKDNWLNKNICGKHIGFFGPHSEESKRKISDSKKGKKRKPFSEEHRRNLSKACKGENNGRYGAIVSEETRKKISNNRKGITSWNSGIIMSEEHRRKISEARKGKVMSEEAKKKISDAVKLRWSTKKLSS